MNPKIMKKNLIYTRRNQAYNLEKLQKTVQTITLINNKKIGKIQLSNNKSQSVSKNLNAS